MSESKRLFMMALLSSKITFLDGNNNMITITLFGSSRTELNFIHDDTIDAREKALC